jgi:hypothetical protein
MANQPGPHFHVRPLGRFNATFGRVEKLPSSPSLDIGELEA